MRTTIFAHRGVPPLLPENSMAGFRYCLQHHADGIEFDVHLTKDNVPVIIHDEKINRTTSGNGLINEYTLAELNQFHLANGETVPTLSEFLALMSGHDIYLNLEFKTDKLPMPGIEEIVLKQVAAANLKHPVIYSSFHLATLQKAYQLDPTQSYNLLYKLPHLHPQRIMADDHLSGLHPHFYIKGLEQHERVWTIDSPAKQTKLIQRRVNGLITNYFERAQTIRDEYQN